jgi:hypothetical protein
MTKPQRYGTSAMPCDSGIFVMHSEYEKVVAEKDALREDAALFQMLVSTCDALDANAFDSSNQPGTLRIVCKHNTKTYPELQSKIVDFIKGYQTRIDASRAKEQA